MLLVLLVLLVLVQFLAHGDLVEEVADGGERVAAVPKPPKEGRDLPPPAVRVDRYLQQVDASPTDAAAICWC